MGNTANLTLVVNGQHFTADTTVRVNGQVRNAHLHDSTRLTTTLEQAHVTQVGSLNITVTKNGMTAAATLSITDGSVVSAPVVNTIRPNTGATGGGTQVTLYGSNFAVPAMKVTFDGIEAAYAPNQTQSQGQVTVLAPVHTAGAVPVKVINPGSNPANTVTVANGFIYTGTVTPPTVTGISPLSGGALGGTPVTITGTGFAPDVEVIIGGAPAAFVQRVNDTTITATTTRHPVGLVAVGVRNRTDGGAATKPNAFTYTPVTDPFELFRVEPAAAPAGTEVKIHGVNFPATGLTVTFGGTVLSGAAVTVHPTGTYLTIIAPSHAAGWVNVKVAKEFDHAEEIKRAFAYTEGPPTVTSLSATSGPDSGGTLTIDGTGFVVGNPADFLPGTTVAVGGVGAAVTVQSSSRLLVTLPKHIAGTVNIDIVNPGLPPLTLENAYTYKLGAPTLLTDLSRTTTSINLQWQDNSGYESAYLLIYTKQGEFEYHFVDLPADSTGKVLTDLLPDQGYYVWVQAWSGPDSSDLSPVLITYTGDQPTPGRPTNHHVVSAGPLGIETAWTDTASNEQTMVVAYARQDVGTWFVASLPANSTSLLHRLPGPGTTWMYFARACRWQANCSNWSDGVLVTAANTPAQSTNLSWTSLAGATTFIDLFWQEGQGEPESSYQVIWTPDSLQYSYTTVPLPANTTTWRHTGLTAFQRFYYWVQSCNGTQCSPLTGPVLATVAGGGGSGPAAANRGGTAAGTAPARGVAPSTPTATATLPPPTSTTTAGTATATPNRGGTAAPVQRPPTSPTATARPAAGPSDPPVPPEPPRLPPPGVVPPVGVFLDFLLSVAPVPAPETFPVPPVNITDPPSRPGPVPSPTPTPTPTPTPSATPSATPTLTPTASTTPTLTPAASSTPTSTPSPSPTVSPTPPATAASSATATASPSPTPTPTATVTGTPATPVRQATAGPAQPGRPPAAAATLSPSPTATGR